MTGYQVFIKRIFTDRTYSIDTGFVYTDREKAIKELNRMYQKTYRNMKKLDWNCKFERKIKEIELTPDLINFYKSLNKLVIN